RQSENPFRSTGRVQIALFRDRAHTDRGKPCARSLFFMFQRFFTELRAAKVPVSLKEYLTLLEAMQKDVIAPYVEDFYYLSRAALVKDERHIDKFDTVFGHVFKGIDMQFELAEGNQVPDEWLQALTERYLSAEEKKQIEELGGWAKMMEQIRE